MPLKASGPLYERLPKFRELYQLMELYETTDPFAMREVRMHVEELRKNILVGKVKKRKELRAIEIWAGQTLFQLRSTMRIRASHRSRLLQRANRLN